MKRLTRSKCKHEGGQLESLSFAVKKRNSEDSEEDEIEPKKQLKNNGSSQKHNPSTSMSSSFEGNGQNNTNNNAEEVEEEEEHLCTKQFNILKDIFQYLPIGDLTKAAQVSILWSQVGRVVRRQRLNHPYIMIYHPPFPMKKITTTKELVDYFNKESSNRNRLDNLIRKVQSRYEDEFEPALWNSFQTYWEPQAVLCIGTRSIRSNIYKKAGAAYQMAVIGENRVMTQHEALFGRMEKVVPCIGVLGNGILTTLPNNFGTTELEEPRLPMMTCLAIPKFPGLRVKIFTFPAHQLKKYNDTGSVNKTTCKRMLNISDEDNVKGIVLFVTGPDERRPVLVRAVHEYLKINPGIGVGCGLMSDCYSSTLGLDSRSKWHTYAFGCGLVFCCDDNVQVGVSVMREPGMTSGNEKHILKFKEAGMDKDAVCSFAFAFASENRGFKMHKHEDAETSMFQRHYPNTPIIGAFTGIEWSHEYIPGQRNISGEPDELIFEESRGSTVFFFVSCKKPPSSY